MTTHWGYLICSLTLAWLPGRWLRNDRCREFQCERLIRRFSETSRRRRRWWKLPAVWIEPIRGYLIVVLLSKALTTSPDATGRAHLLTLLATLAVLLVGVSLQMPSKRHKASLVAPVGYVGGILLAWLPFKIGPAAIALGAASALAFRYWEAGFLIGGVSCLAIGWCFVGACERLMAISLVFVWPVIAAWLLQKRLVLPVRS